LASLGGDNEGCTLARGTPKEASSSGTGADQSPGRNGVKDDTAESSGDRIGGIVGDLLRWLVVA